MCVLILILQIESEMVKLIQLYKCLSTINFNTYNYSKQSVWYSIRAIYSNDVDFFFTKLTCNFTRVECVFSCKI